MRTSCIFLLILLVCSSRIELHAQNDSTKKVQFSLNGGAMLYSALPAFLFKNDIAKFHSTFYTPIEGTPRIIPGYFLGAEFFLRPFKKRGFFAGINLSYHRLLYHYSESSMGAGLSSYTYVYNSSNINTKSDYYTLNIEFGLRRKLGRRFALLHTLLIHQNIYSYTNEQGYNYHSEGSNYPSGQNYNIQTTTPVNNTSTKWFELSGVSYRFGIRYIFKTGNSKTEVCSFRNFGFPARPWWGLGLNFFVH